MGYKIKIFQRQYRLILFVMVLSFLWSPVFAAQPFVPEKKIYIETRYSGDLRDIMGDSVIWEIFSRGTDKGFILEYRKDGSKLFCSLGSVGSNPVKAFTLSGPTYAVIDTASGAFIPFLGFPAPCRIFAIEEFNQPGRFDMIREAGGRKFSTRFFYESLSVSPKDAVKEGWLEVEPSDDQKDRELVLISIRNSAGDLLFSQLWEKGASWWLYEETKDSRSWKKE